MITVHHLNRSRSFRVLWLLEELGFDYEVVSYARDLETVRAPESLKSVHPLGKAPVMIDGDVTLAESGAIFEHLLERDGQARLTPAPGTQERALFRTWMHYAEGSLQPLLVMKFIFDRIEAAPAPFFIQPIKRSLVARVNDALLRPDIKANLVYLEDHLSRHDWFAGADFSAADVMMSFPVEAAASRIGLNPNYPKLTAFLDRIHARPAYQRAEERGGPLDLPKPS